MNYPHLNYPRHFQLTMATLLMGQVKRLFAWDERTRHQPNQSRIDVQQQGILRHGTPNSIGACGVKKENAVQSLATLQLVRQIVYSITYISAVYIIYTTLLHICQHLLFFFATIHMSTSSCVIGNVTEPRLKKSKGPAHWIDLDACLGSVR